MRVLITRPQPDADMLADRLRMLGHEPVVAPLLETRLCHEDPLPTQNVAAVISTSRNALRALGANESFAVLRKLPLFVVGPASAKFAVSMGFETVISGKDGAEDLVQQIVSSMAPAAGKMLYLCGKQVAVDVAGLLSSNGFEVVPRVVYEMIEKPEFDNDVLSLLNASAIDAVILLSSRTAKVFDDLINKAHVLSHGGDLPIICLSKNVAQHVEKHDGFRLVVAKKPMLEEVISLVNHEASQLT